MMSFFRNAQAMTILRALLVVLVILTEINVSFRYNMQHQLLSGMSMTGFLYKR